MSVLVTPCVDSGSFSRNASWVLTGRDGNRAEQRQRNYLWVEWDALLMPRCLRPASHLTAVRLRHQPIKEQQRTMWNKLTTTGVCLDPPACFDFYRWSRV